MNTVKIITDPAHPEYRARIVLDEMPHEPEDDGACPIVQLEYFHGWQAETIDRTFSKDVYSKTRAVEDAAVHFLSGGYDGMQKRGYVALERFERYLRIFHGCSGVDIYENGSQYYIAYDPAEVREKWGLEVLPDDMATAASLSEFRDYLNGDVFGCIVEKAEVWTRYGAEGRLKWNEAEGCWRTIYGDEDIRVEWTEVDSLWGLYGDVDAWPSESAEEQLKEAWSD